MSKHDSLRQQLEQLRAAVPELRGVLLASNEGLPVAHSLTHEIDPNKLAAIASAGLNLGRRISESTQAGPIEEVSVRGDDGVLLIYAAGKKAMLVTIAPTTCSLGLAHIEARTTAIAIRGLLDEANSKAA